MSGEGDVPPVPIPPPSPKQNKEKTMTEIKQCWAFHRDGARCEHPAGHNGDHVVQKTWKDIECATPGEFDSQPAPLVTGKSVTEPIGTHERTIKCVACSHAHRNAECKCGCHEFIG